MTTFTHNIDASPSTLLRQPLMNSTKLASQSLVLKQLRLTLELQLAMYAHACALVWLDVVGFECFNANIAGCFNRFNLLRMSNPQMAWNPTMLQLSQLQCETHQLLKMEGKIKIQQPRK